MKSRLSSRSTPSPEFSDASDGIESKTRDAFVKANSEMEAVFQEGMKLESQGSLDAATTARIEARLQAISTKLDKDLADQVSQINTRYAVPKPWLLPKPFRVPFVAVLVFLIGGSLLEITVGAGFIFSGGTGYSHAMPWLFGVLIPVFALGWFLLERVNHNLRARYPTWLVRWLIVFPLVVALTATMAVVSPLGWAALLGWITGSPSRVEVSVISVDAPSRRSSGCDHYAHLEFDGTTARICLEGRLAGPAPHAGERVAVAGRVSRLGLLIDRIDHQ